MPPRLRKHSTLVFGESKTGKDDTEELLAADANLVASGVSKDATCDQLKGFLAGKGINVTDIELISNAPERRTNTFRIAIKAVIITDVTIEETNTHQMLQVLISFILTRKTDLTDFWIM